MADNPQPADPKSQYVQAMSQGKPAEPKDIIETTLWTGGYSAKAMIGAWVVAALASIGLLIAMAAISSLRTNTVAWYVVLILLGLLWLGLLLTMAYHKLAHRYELTNQRLKHRDGILVQTTNRVELIDIDDVMYKQGPIQLLMNVGNITVKSSDASHPELILIGIADVRKVADTIDDARRAERRRRGVFVESV